MTITEAALQKIERLVFSNRLPTAESLNQEGYDKLLDKRDADEFAVPWTDAYEVSKAPFKQLAVDQGVKARIDKLREYVYERVYSQTKVSDLASYTSDDIDLILRYLLTAVPSMWANSLWLCYEEGAIPSGTLNEIPGNLAELITA